MAKGDKLKNILKSLKANPYIAALLSFSIAGLGQFYIGMYRRGLYFLALDVITTIGYFKVDNTAGFVANTIVSIAAAYDAYNQTISKKGKKKKEKEEKVKRPEIRVF